MSSRSVSVLVLTNMYPSAEHPSAGVFISRQVQSLRDAGLSVEVLVLDRSSDGPSSYRRLRGLTRSAVRRFRPDVVHVMYGGVMAAIVANAATDVSVVISYCGTDLLGQPEAPLGRRLLSRLGVWCSGWAAKRAAGVIVKSEELARALPRTTAPVRIIPNGVDLDRFRPRDVMEARRVLGWAPDGFHVLFADSPDPTKRADLAEAAVAALPRFGVTPTLQRLRDVSPDDVPNWLNAASVLLLTSRHEGSPNIIKEAMACDLPIVSVDVGDVRERIEGARWCAIAAAEPDALAAAMAKLDSEPRRSNGREHIGSLGEAAIAKQLIDFYETLVFGEPSD